MSSNTIDVPRAVCRRCRRPERFCYCARLPSLQTRARIVFLQHPRESRVPIGTARMAHLALPNSELHSGIQFDDNARIAELRAAPGTALLFPGEGAIDPSELSNEPLRHLIVIDGTWAQAKKVLKLNPALRALPRVGLNPKQPGNYRIRKEPSAECLATIEAVAELLSVLEGEPEKFRAMLGAFNFMVDQQIAQMANRPKRRDKRPRLRPENDEQRLLARRAQLVFVHAEVNAHARELNVPGTPELLHLVARRASGESFAAILAPRRPLAPNATCHLGVSEETLRAGESIEAVRARWRAFAREEDLLVGWGSFTREQLVYEELLVEPLVSPRGEPLAEPPGDPAGERSAHRPYIDLRLAVARRLQARPGAAEEAVARLGGTLAPSRSPARADRVVATLAQVVNALEAVARKQGPRRPVYAPAAAP